jgi:hypothetical protein
VATGGVAGVVFVVMGVGVDGMGLWEERGESGEHCHCQWWWCGEVVVLWLMC